MASTLFELPAPPAAPSRPRAPRRPRRSVVLATVVLLAGLVIVLPATLFRADASSGIAMDYVSRINGLRASRGLGPLEIDGNLTGLAEAHSASMASSQVLRHSGSLASGVALPWMKLGENIGTGPTTDMVWNAFVSSPTHLANMVNGAYSHIGVGVVIDGNGTQWVTQRFLQYAAPAANTAPAPAPRPTPPPPAPRPRPTAPPTTAPPVVIAPEPPPPPPPPPTEPSPADPGRVASVLDALRVPATAAQKADQPTARASAVLTALRAR